MEEIRQLHSDLSEQVIRDPLTALHNRRYLNETLDRELARAGREAYRVGLVMMDIDNFKEINDSYGHDAGDQVLKNMACHLAGAGARRSDLVCRLGGDEFLLVMPKADGANTFKRAEQLRKSFEDSVSIIKGSEVRSTLSAGVALFPDQGSTSGEVIAAADRASV